MASSVWVPESRRAGCESVSDALDGRRQARRPGLIASQFQRGIGSRADDSTTVNDDSAYRRVTGLSRLPFQFWSYRTGPRWAWRFKDGELFFHAPVVCKCSFFRAAEKKLLGTTMHVFAVFVGGADGPRLDSQDDDNFDPGDGFGDVPQAVSWREHSCVSSGDDISWGI